MKMGATFDAKFENRNNLNLEELRDGLNKSGFDVFIKYGDMLKFKDNFGNIISSIIYIEEENMFILGTTWGTLLSYQQPVDWNHPLPKVNTDFLNKWNKVVISVMKITGSKIAIALHEALQMCHGFDVIATALHGIYYKKLEDALPIVRNSIKEFLEREGIKKRLSNRDVKEIIEKSTCIQEKIDNINFKFFWCADLPKRTLKNRLVEVLEEKYSKK